MRYNIDNTSVVRTKRRAGDRDEKKKIVAVWTERERKREGGVARSTEKRATHSGIGRGNYVFRENRPNCTRPRNYGSPRCPRCRCEERAIPKPPHPGYIFHRYDR